MNGHTAGQTDKQTKGQTDRQMQGQQAERWNESQTYGETNRNKDYLKRQKNLKL